MKKEKSLFQLRRFWILGSLPIILGVVVAFVIVFNSELDPNFSYQGFNNSVVIFKVPLGISALVFPVVALVAASHRSEQTKKQILLGQEQNVFVNYYKHREEFDKLISVLEDAQELKRIDRAFLYSKIFPENSPSNLVIHPTGGIMEDVVDKYVSVMSHISNENSSEAEAMKVFEIIVKLSKELSVSSNRKITEKVTITDEEDGVIVHEIISPTVILYGQVELLAKVIYKLAEFCSMDKRHAIDKYYPSDKGEERDKKVFSRGKEN